MAKPDDSEYLTLEGHTVRVSNPAKLYFTKQVQVSKLDIVKYFLSVAPGALQGIRNRPIVLKRFVNGAEGEPFYQKRAPDNLPEYVQTVTLSFPSGRTAEECVINNTASLAWMINLGCMELHPHPVLASDLDHPNELRVDLDPGPGVGWDSVRDVAMVAKQVLEDHGLRGWPKTSGSRGIHINVRIEPRWSFTEVRRAALAFAREVERRAPALATSKWWKEERHGVFLDYNQNAKDRTTASAYSVRPLPDARVSAPLNWEEVLQCDPADFTVFTMPARFAAIGDPHAEMDAAAGSLDALLELAARDESSGLGDAPWPPHFAKGEGEPARVAPSRAKKAAVAKDFGAQLEEGFGAKRFRKRSMALSATPAQNEGNHDPVGQGIGPDDQNRTSDLALAAEAQDVGAAGTTGAPAAAKSRRKPRVSKMPLVIVSQSPDRAAADAGLERWKLAHPEAAALLAVDDVLVDRMRGTAYVWYRIRVNLRHVPEADRPAQATPDPDDDPTRAWREGKDAATSVSGNDKAHPPLRQA